MIFDHWLLTLDQCMRFTFSTKFHSRRTSTVGTARCWSVEVSPKIVNERSKASMIRHWVLETLIVAEVYVLLRYTLTSTAYPEQSLFKFVCPFPLWPERSEANHSLKRHKLLRLSLIQAMASAQDLRRVYIFCKGECLKMVNHSRSYVFLSVSELIKELYFLNARLIELPFTI